MYKREKIIAFTERHKPIIWGLFLSTIIFKHAVGSVSLWLLSLLYIIQFKKTNFNRNFLTIWLYFVWGVASLIWSTNFWSTLSGVITSLPILIIPLLFSQYSAFESEDFNKLIRVFSICLLFYLLICFINSSLLFYQDKKFVHFFYHSLVSIYDNNAIYISLAVAMCVLGTINFSKKLIIDYIILLFLSFFLLLLSSKNIVLTTLFLSLLTIISNKKKQNFFITVIFSGSVMFFFLIIYDNPIKERFVNELNLNINHIWFGQDFYNYKFSGLGIRLFQWRLMMEMITNNQIGVLGLGLHNVNYLLNQYFNYYNLYNGYFYINFHNQYLQTLGELGFIGLALLIIIFFRLIKNKLKTKNKYQLSFILLFMIAFLTESFLSRQKGVFLFITMYSLFFSLSNKEGYN